MFNKPKKPMTPEEFAEQEMFPPSREERRQTAWTIGTILVAVAGLGIGMGLRYTVFAERYSPKPLAVLQGGTPTPAPTAAPATPSPTPTPLATPTPEATPYNPPSALILGTPRPSASPGAQEENVSPSLLESGGVPVAPQ